MNFRSKEFNQRFLQPDKAEGGKTISRLAVLHSEGQMLTNQRECEECSWLARPSTLSRMYQCKDQVKISYITHGDKVLSMPGT